MEAPGEVSALTSQYPRSDNHLTLSREGGF